MKDWLRVPSSRCALSVFVLAFGSSALAQHEQHQSPPPTQHPPDTTKAASKMDTSGMPPMRMNMPMGSTQMTSSSFVPGVPHEREGSGTSWQPDHSPVRAFHWMRGDWMIMLHGMASLRYTNHDVTDEGTRGDDLVDGPNWAMLMGQRPVGANGQLTLRTMMSLDRATEGGDGYPLLFQSGESWEGVPLVDRQHPHDLFMELAAAYGQRIGESGVFVYAGYPGEPALGPPAFMHRPSALNMLDAPLGHHWQDATHIAYGVLTGGFIHHDIKLDASVFTGREPDENRWNFDDPKFDSYSGRVSYNPSSQVALQVSAGQLHSPEALEPDVDVTRFTASVLHHHPLGDGRLWTSSLVWGANDPSVGKATHTILAESDWERPLFSPYGRVEYLQKSGHDLQMGADDDVYDIGVLTLGGAVQLLSNVDVDLSAHVQGSGYAVPEALQGVYGERPWSVEVYVQLMPAGARHGTAGRGEHEN